MRASAPTNDLFHCDGGLVLRERLHPVEDRLEAQLRALPAGVCHHPWSSALIRPPLSWTIPYPQAAVPGSMPRTFTREG